MAEKPTAKPPVQTETLPSFSGRISAIASANAPFVYFENATFFGYLNDIGQITLEADRIMSDPDGKPALDRVVVAHLRGSLAAIKSFRSAIDGILLMAKPHQEGPAN
jgi:hypothetical protein